jgi:hypothetical protein
MNLNLKKCRENIRVCLGRTFETYSWRPIKRLQTRQARSSLGNMDSSSDDERLAADILAGQLGNEPALGPVLDPSRLLSDDSIENDINDYLMESSDGSDESIDLEYLESLRRQRLPRCTDTYHYSGDVMKAIQHNH